MITKEKMKEEGLTAYVELKLSHGNIGATMIATSVKSTFELIGVLEQAKATLLERVKNKSNMIEFTK